MSADEEVDWNSIYKVLADETRREFLSLLIDTGTELSIEDVRAQTIQRSSDRESRARAETETVHVHLPLLLQAGLVDYDPERDVVQSTSLAERLPKELLSPTLAPEAGVPEDAETDAPSDRETK